MTPRKNNKDLVLIGFTLLISFVLVVMPLPDKIIWARPQWAFIIVLFWVIAAPHRMGIGAAWTIGLIVDLLTGTLLGQHALTFALSAYVLMNFHPRMIRIPLWRQSLMIMILSMLNLAIQYWVMGIFGAPPQTWWYWLPALTTALFWPWVSLLLNEYQIKLRLLA